MKAFISITCYLRRLISNIYYIVYYLCMTERHYCELVSVLKPSQILQCDQNKNTSYGV